MLGLHVADLGTDTLEVGQRVVFSIQDLATGTWFESDRVIEVVAQDAVASDDTQVVSADRYGDQGWVQPGSTSIAAE